MTEDLFGAPGATKPHAVVPNAGMVPAAAGAARVALNDAPRAAPQHLQPSRRRPCRVHLSLRSVVPIPVRHPFQHIACHIQSAAPTGTIGIRTDTCRIAHITAAVCQGVTGRAITPRIDEAIWSSRRVLLLCLYGQTCPCPFTEYACASYQLTHTAG